MPGEMIATGEMDVESLLESMRQNDRRCLTKKQVKKAFLQLERFVFNPGINISFGYFAAGIYIACRGESSLTNEMGITLFSMIPALSSVAIESIFSLLARGSKDFLLGEGRYAHEKKLILKLTEVQGCRPEYDYIEELVVRARRN